jgi:hypothetical protein
VARAVLTVVAWVVAWTSVGVVGCGSLNREAGIMGTSASSSAPRSDDQLRTLIGKRVMVTLRGVDWGYVEGELVRFDVRTLTLRASADSASWGIPAADIERLIADESVAVQEGQPGLVFVSRIRIERIWQVGSAQRSTL